MAWREKRNDVRYPGQTLMLEVNGRIHPLIDISTGGLGFEGDGFVRGQMLAARISSVLDGTDEIRAPCRVANIRGSRIGVSFTAPNLQLLKYIIGHIGNVTSTLPFVLKKIN